MSTLSDDAGAGFFKQNIDHYLIFRTGHTNVRSTRYQLVIDELSKHLNLTILTLVSRQRLMRFEKLIE